MWYLVCRIQVLLYHCIVVETITYNYYFPVFRKRWISREYYQQDENGRRPDTVGSLSERKRQRFLSRLDRTDCHRLDRYFCRFEKLPQINVGGKRAHSFPDAKQCARNNILHFIIISMPFLPSLGTRDLRSSKLTTLKLHIGQINSPKTFIRAAL